MSRLLSLHALTLKKRPLGEKDLLVKVLTHEGVLQNLILKGAGVGSSKRRGHVDGLNLIQGLIRKKGDYHYLQNVVCLHSFPELKQDLDKVLLAGELLHLTELHLKGAQPHPEIYTLLIETLTVLNTVTPSPLFTEMVKAQMAHHLGLLPNFHHCGRCHRFLEEETAFKAPNDLLLCQNCSENRIEEAIESKYRKALEFFRKTSIKNCPSFQVSMEEEHRLKNLISCFLTPSTL